VHPRTALWWQQRETCLKCANVQLKTVGTGDNECRVMHCKKAFTRTMNNGRVDNRSCLAMRDEGAACGPDAKLLVLVLEGAES
jgi:hypothetical protein